MRGWHSQRTWAQGHGWSLVVLAQALSDLGCAVHGLRHHLQHATYSGARQHPWCVSVLPLPTASTGKVGRAHFAPSMQNAAAALGASPGCERSSHPSEGGADLDVAVLVDDLLDLPVDVSVVTIGQVGVGCQVLEDGQRTLGSTHRQQGNKAGTAHACLCRRTPHIWTKLQDTASCLHPTQLAQHSTAGWCWCKRPPTPCAHSTWLMPGRPRSPS